jgi:hypothetical protein
MDWNEDHVKMLRSLFQCPQCRTNNHTFPSCPLLKHWHIKKKNRSDTTPDINTTGAVRSAYVQSQSDTIPTPSPEVLEMLRSHSMMILIVMLSLTYYLKKQITTR